MKPTLFLLFVTLTAFSYWLRHINLRHLRQYGTKVPKEFAGAIDEEKLLSSSAYTVDSSRLGLWESLFDNALLVLFLFGGLIVIYDRWVGGLCSGPVLNGILFFLLLTWCQTLLGMPFDLYGTFVIEARYGFNTMTPRLWVLDFLKSQLIGAVLLAVLIAAVFSLIGWSQSHWWLWVWSFLALFSLFMMFISPYVIEPLFNKFEPVTEEGLEDEIRAMMEKAGLKVGRVMQMDASRRSRHSNAYFTGIGRVKRIVLFDTLIRQMTHGEIVAVLAHEIGHWKRGHIWKRLLEAEVMALAGAWISFRLLGWEGLPGVLGLPADLSLPGRVVVLGLIGSLVMFPLGPLSAWRSRCQEREADRFAAELTGRPQDLASALVKLSAENLSNLFPHPFYAAFHYSHPPVVERVRTLNEWASSLKSGEARKLEA
ncbi:M48 family metallopeptidase [Geobacter sp. SVR]|uniref:M48 family metallopeptidase n=1 Tax=Geobacter sp. SVR TaxID=2495594 RepID=UPI00143EF718|nr:M48 family metallopeptidase [Geobacter sp. SVR]BCS52380.1 peptidase M48 [Geobacter sp. SVR]GCF84961.1 peptidase M48 [Geobacter sp. SVR]